MKTSKQLIDQTLHVLWALIALLPITLWPNPAGGALSGLLLALPREIWDQRKNLSDAFPWITRGKLLDLGFFMLGGLVAGIVAL